MGAAPALGLTSFTLEAWFKMDGLGGSVGTGSHGIHVFPLISKGNGNTDPEDKTLDINYILGIQNPTDGPMVLVADFESTEANPFRNGMNHTIYGVTPIEMSNWHHVAATYDGFEWRMYLDGNLEMRTVHRMVPQYESQHHFGIGASIDNKGVAHGGFKGVIDEVRVWDFARSGQEIRSTLNDEIEQAAGLIGRWGFNEATGSVAYDSSGNDIHGQMVYANWTSNAPMNTNVAPTIISELCPNSNQNLNAVELAVTIENPDSAIFPPQIKLLLGGIKQDGRKRALMILISFFKCLGVPDIEIEKRMLEWNEKNYNPIKKGYILSQLSWYKRHPDRLPPNFSNPIYKDLNVDKPDKLAMETKNPVSYAVKRYFQLRK